jgi:hypothetical protein
LRSEIANRPLTHQERGRLGARTRWGEQRIVRMDELDADTARLIRALLAQRPADPVKEPA